VGLGEGALAPLVAEAAFAPDEIGDTPSKRYLARPHHRTLLDHDRRAPAVRAQAGARDRLDVEVEPVANLDTALYLQAIQPDQAGKVVLPPVVLLVSRSVTTQSLPRAAQSLR
jgi:hypothetical protein